MDGERKINLGEGVPLNSTGAGAANIFLNTGRNTKSKANSPDGTVIQLKTEKPSDLGIHINTTLSIASSKKIKLLFVLNFLLSLVCMVICCSVAFYYWNEMISMRRQLDLIKDHFLIQDLPNLSQDKIVQNALGRHRMGGEREPRMDTSSHDMPEQSPKKYYVEALGEDMLLVDSKKKNLSEGNMPTLAILQKDPLVVHFNGAKQEKQLGTSLIGPWSRDNDVSSKNSADKIELNDRNQFVTIKESGLYLIYAEVTYLTRSPTLYSIMASRTGSEPRILSVCASGDVSTTRPIEKSQISCSTQTVARLNNGEEISLAQREVNRTAWLSKGYSYFGFVKLSS